MPAPERPAAISVRNITKRYGRITALDDVSLGIAEGEIFGLLGPNGAGKTTLIRLVSAQAVPGSGRVEVFGLDAAKSPTKVKALLGIVPQEDIVDRDLTVMQNLVFHARLHGMERADYGRRIAEVLRLTKLSGRAGDYPDKLSGGLRRRAVIANALVHRPRALLLDEPTTGLDPQSRLAIWKRIRRLKAGGMTMVLTTHNMEEADLLCDRVAVIDRGRIAACGTPTELKAMLEGGNIVEVMTKGPLEFGADLPASSVERRGSLIRFRTADKKRLVLELLSRHGDSISSLDFHAPTLEDVFIHLTGRRLRE